MTNTLLMAFIACLILGLLVSAWVFIVLMRANKAMKVELQRLNGLLGGSHNDLAGLCAAALAMDQRIAVTEEELKLLWSRLSELAEPRQINPISDHPYQSAIQKVRSGAGINELMQNSGLSHDEAALLIRLHGAKTPG